MEMLIHILIADGSDNKIFASMYFFPGNFTKANLPQAKISISNMSLYLQMKYSFSLQFDAAAVYVMLDSGVWKDISVIMGF
uniref:Uncharacterized protein n=1 Tax=Amphimedon queenslandica TaxID=400682 RepID=A0A1X7TYA8_AMPQE